MTSDGTYLVRHAVHDEIPALYAQTVPAEFSKYLRNLPALLSEVGYPIFAMNRQIYLPLHR